jgi:multidrug resistance efflux pump
MRNEVILDLADCAEFRQALQARPPRIIHGTALLLIGLLGTALVWSAVTQADLIVRASGRVRPVTSLIKVFVPGRGDMSSVSFGGRVVEVNVQPGDEVKKGDVLLRLDTARLDNEIAKRKRTIRAGEDELAQLDCQKGLLARHYKVARAKAKAELAQAIEDVRQAKERQVADVRQAKLDLKGAEYEATQLRQLVPSRAAAPLELVRATVRVGEAKEKLAKFKLPVDDGKVKILRQALELVEKEYALRCNELEMKRGIKQSEVQAAGKDLANLELERKQAVICAPLEGVVATGELKVGDYLEPGKQVVEIAEQKGFRFEVAVQSEDVAHLRVGMPARIKLDAYDYQKYGTLDGTVCFLSPDSTVGDGQRTATYIVKIELHKDEVGRGDLRGRVKLGMAGQAEIITDRESLLVLLLKKLRQTISLG